MPLPQEHGVFRPIFVIEKMFHFLYLSSRKRFCNFDMPQLSLSNSIYNEKPGEMLNLLTVHCIPKVVVNLPNMEPIPENSQMGQKSPGGTARMGVQLLVSCQIVCLHGYPEHWLKWKILSVKSKNLQVRKQQPKIFG